MEGQVGRGSGLASKQSPRPQARASTQDLTPTPDPDSEIGELWSALTDPRRLAGWFADVQGDLRRGGEFHAHIFNSGDVTGRVEACESPYRLLVSIRDADPQPGQPEEEVIEVTLTTDDDETTLIWEERGMPANLLAAYGAGVQVHVEDLAAYVNGRERVGPARWNELLPAYQALAADLG